MATGRIAICQMHDDASFTPASDPYLVIIIVMANYCDLTCSHAQHYIGVALREDVCFNLT